MEDGAKSAQLTLERRSLIRGGAFMFATYVARGPSVAGTIELIGFDDLSKSFGFRGLEFSDRLHALRGLGAAIRGLMAPPLKADTNFFVLTREPVAICPFCSSDAEWPVDIVVVFLTRAATPRSFSDPLEVTGTVEVGSKIDADTGFVSQIRLIDAQFHTV